MLFHAAAGDVDAPIAVPIVAALVVTAAVTFAVPAYLNRGKRVAPTWHWTWSLVLGYPG